MNIYSNNSRGLCYTCPNRHFHFCNSLLNGSSDKFDAHAVKHLNIPAKQFLYHQCDMDQELLVLREGWIMLTRISESGKRQVFRTVLPGELLGFQHYLHANVTYTAITLMDSVVCRIPNIANLCATQPKLMLSLASSVACDMMLTEMYLAHITQRRARERIAFMVLELYHRLKRRQLNQLYSIQFPFKQEDIADMLGLTTIHVNRVLHILKDENILEIHRQELTILNYDALCMLVGPEFFVE